MTGVELAILDCANCGARFMACPQCVCTVRIDPQTGFPPDVRVIDGKAVHNPKPDPEAVQRSEKRPVCDDCVRKRNAIRQKGGKAAAHMEGPWETWEERHDRTHREGGRA